MFSQNKQHLMNETGFAGWTTGEITEVYKYENPTWDEDKCLDKANIIYKELKKLNNNMEYSDKKYALHNISPNDYNIDFEK